MKIFFFSLLTFLFTNAMAIDLSLKPISIIPIPVSVKQKAGSFEIKPSTKIYIQDEKLRGIADLFAEQVAGSTGFSTTVLQNKSAVKNAIYFKLNAKSNPEMGKEGYAITVSNSNIHVAANTPHGAFNGMQSLIQLIPTDGLGQGANGKWELPCVEIFDQPRLEWRGLMLDVSRHFFSKEFVKKYIDEMAKYKYNVFHWHLSDDNGWRIEIEGMPKLTEIGAWRAKRNGPWGSLAPQPGEKATYGGYYTQDDIREIVAYAEKRFITIIPEIDVPGHSLALISAYPELSCRQHQHGINNGSPFKEEENVLCIANDAVYTVLDKIFTQVAALFPGKYIHVGGDEVNPKFWERHAAERDLMKRENLTSFEALQGYFEKKMEKMILSKGKKMICWYGEYVDELSKESAIMSWQGVDGGIKSAKRGVPVIMSPHLYTYLDYFQGDPLVEPTDVVGGMLRLKKSYDFEPIPDGVDPKYILGGQANLWTESVPTERHVEYMTWPRALALAEVFWSPKSKKNWPEFVNRVESRFKYMDAAQVNYAKSMYDPIVTAIQKDGELRVKLDAEIPGVQLYYTFDGTNPDHFSASYDGNPLAIPKEAAHIRVVAYRNANRIGIQINVPLTELGNRIVN